MISIIIPLYNKEESISSTIKSVLNQSFKDFELIVVNDGSTDKSLSIVNQFDDPRIKIFSKDNGGVSMARNFGAQKAQFLWLFFLDADDSITEDCLSVYIKMIKEFPEISFFTTNFKAKASNGQETLCCYNETRGIVKYPFKALWQRKIFPRTGAMLIHKLAYNKVGGFRKESSLWEDLELVLKMLRKFSIAYDPKPVFTHILAHNMLSQRTQPLNNEFAYYIDLKEPKLSSYHKLLLLELLVRTKNKRNEQKDYEAVRALSKKIGNRSLFLFLGKVERYLNKTRRKFK